MEHAEHVRLSSCSERSAFTPVRSKRSKTFWSTVLEPSPAPEAPHFVQPPRTLNGEIVSINISNPWRDAIRVPGIERPVPLPHPKLDAPVACAAWPAPAAHIATTHSGHRSEISISQLLLAPQDVLSRSREHDNGEIAQKKQRSAKRLESDEANARNDQTTSHTTADHSSDEQHKLSDPDEQEGHGDADGLATQGQDNVPPNSLGSNSSAGPSGAASVTFLNSAPPYILPEYLEHWVTQDFLVAMTNINSKYGTRIRSSSFERSYADAVIDVIRKHYGTSVDALARMVDWREFYSTNRGQPTLKLMVYIFGVFGCNPVHYFKVDRAAGEIERGITLGLSVHAAGHLWNICVSAVRKDIRSTKDVQVLWDQVIRKLKPGYTIPDWKEHYNRKIRPRIGGGMLMIDLILEDGAWLPPYCGVRPVGAAGAAAGEARVLLNPVPLEHSIVVDAFLAQPLPLGRAQLLWETQKEHRLRTKSAHKQQASSSVKNSKAAGPDSDEPGSSVDS